MTKLQQFVFLDSRTRRKYDRISQLIAFAFAAFCISAGAPAKVTGLGTLAVLAAAMIGGTAWYCLKPRYVLTKSDLPGFQVSRLAYIAATAVALFFAMSTPQIEAAMLSRRLRRDVSLLRQSALEKRPLPTNVAKNLINTLRYAKDSKILVPQEILTAINNSLSKLPSEDQVHPIATELANYNSSRTAQPPLEATENPSWAVDNISVSLPPALPGSKMPRRISVAVSTAPTDWEHSAYSRQGTEPVDLRNIKYPSVIVFRGVGVEQNVVLDGLSARHVFFENFLVVYGGGPLQLEDVEFVECLFEVRTNENGITLTNLLRTTTKVEKFHAV